MATTDVVVVGGGAVGLASAWRLAREGLGVTVVDEHPGRAASWAAAGMLAPATEAHYGEERLVALNLASRDLWPAFAAALEETTGADPGYRPTGTLVVARDRDDLVALDELRALHEGLGLGVERLSSRETRRLEPALDPGVRGGLLAIGDDQVDNRALVGALLAAAERSGVALVADRVTDLAVAGSRVTGAVLAGGGRLAADTVVLAAGAWSAALVPELPVRPVKGQLLHLAGDDLLARNVRVPGGRPARSAVYLVPRGDGRLVVGATVEEQGFDLTVTAGAVLDLLREAYELVPGLAELALVETVAGLRPGTPDNAPLIGPGPLDGLVVATGHFRNGILLAPVTAEAVAALVVDGKAPDVVTPFAPERFDGGRS